MSICHGNAPDSPCCQVGEMGLCPFVLPGPHADGRRAACALYVELGSWEAVHDDERYVPIHEHWIQHGVPDCGDWVGPGCCYGPMTDEARASYVIAAARPGTPVEVRRQWGLEPPPVERKPEPPPVPPAKKQRVPLGQRPKP